jgi:lysophospholipase L1-like esterase
MTRWARTIKNPWLRDGLLLLGSVAVSLILGECLLRVFASRLPREIRNIVTARPENLGVFDSYIGHRHRPNATIYISGRDFLAAHHTDELGFRNSLGWPEHAEMVVVGDSVTFGYGVKGDEAWPEIMQRALPETRMINLGLIGAGAEQYLRLYKTYGRKLQPKLLLVGFFARNDFWDTGLFHRWLETDRSCNYMVWRDYGRPRDCGNSLSWQAVLWANRSYLHNLVFGLTRSIRRQIRMHTELFHLADGRTLQLDIEDFMDKTRGGHPERREFQLALRSLQNLHARASEAGTRVLIVLQPSKEEVYLPLLGKPFFDPSRALRAVLEESGIEYLNLTPAFRNRAAKGQQLFFEIDGHPNAAGHGLIAAEVIDYLRNNSKRASQRLSGVHG